MPRVLPGVSDIAGIVTRRRKFTAFEWDGADDYDDHEMCALEALTLLPAWVAMQKYLTKLGASVIKHPGGYAILMKDGRVFTGVKQGTDGPELIEQTSFFPLISPELLRKKGR